MDKLNKIINSDCIVGMKEIKDGSIDLIIADPPYNLSKGEKWSFDSSKKTQGFGGDWKKVMQEWDNYDLLEYFQFTLAWLKECKRVLKKSGSIWIYGTYHNIGIINFALQLLEVEIINEIVWYKRNAFPNLSGRRFTASHETLLWGHKGNEKNRNYKFNYELMKNMDFPEDLLKKEGKQMRTVWDIPNNKKKEELKFGKHPTQKPVRITERILLSSTDEGDTILVPFAGSGTECVAAKKNNRNYIGFELDEKYIKIAVERLNEIKKQKEATLF
jgi:site-specific DNA-methyltransferase (adenine-specific)